MIHWLWLAVWIIIYSMAYRRAVNAFPHKLSAVNHWVLAGSLALACVFNELACIVALAGK